jgi:hypothetical protein
MPQVSKNIWDFDPRSVGGCQLWFDAADSLTVTLNGSTVSSWKDKSINGYTVDQSTSGNQPTYATNLLNGLPGIQFSASRYLYQLGSNMTNFTSSTSTTVFIVAKNGSSLPSSGFNIINTLWLKGTATQRYHFSFASSSTNGVTLYANAALVGTTTAVTFGSNAIIGFTASPSGTSINVNGTLTTYNGTTLPSANNTTYFMFGDDRGNFSSDVNVYEFIGFNTELTTSQRQQVEGYLAYKWGLQSSLISTHSFYSIKPHLRIFQPSDFSDLSVWFDASDTSTITGTSTVTAWRDKSSNSWNATTLIGTAPTNTTVNGLNAVSFSGASTLTVSNVAFSSVQSRAVFVVYRVPTSTPNYISWFSTQWSGGNNQGGHNNLVYPSGGGGPFLQSYAAGGLSYTFLGTSSAPSTIGTTAQCAMINSAFSTTSNVVTLNGTSYTLDNGMIAAGYSTSTVTYYIGNAYPQPYILCEYIMYQREFTQSERQIVEGYLANKWGIRSTLPSTHPFKTFPASASLPFFLPTNLPGCQLWLDGADSSTITLSGSNVTQWRDKSASSNHFTPTSGTPTSILDNGRKVVNFTSGTIMTSANKIVFTTSSAFFIVSRLNSINSSNAGMLLSFTDIGGGDKSIRFFGPNGILAGTASMAGDGNDLANNNYYVNGTFNPSFGSSTYLNVYSIIGTVAPSSGGTSFLTFSSSFMSRFFIGNIAEFLYYPTGLTTAQRQQVEGYLAYKWDIKSSLPTTHPYYNFSPSFNLFSDRFTAPETILKIGGTTYHVFISTGTFNTIISRTVNYLFVGGGGGGADRHGGGGGAGGVQSGTWTPAAGSYTVTVGVGGEGGNYEMNNSFPRGSGLIGGVSTISGVNTALGGGGGGTYDGNPTGSVGSGGGGGGNSLAGVAGTSGQGNSGGAGGSAATAYGGGGGGAGGSGFAGPGQGGVGTTAYSATLLAVGYGTLFAVPSFPNSVLSGGLAYIAGGGGGGTGTPPGPGGSGGLGGGGRGDYDNFFISAGTPNTGGGGGGGRSSSGAGSSGARGGSGLVIIWY